jgi:hypothetical protein
MPKRKSKDTGPKPLWTYPRCRRQFANRNQAHSCGQFTVEQLLEGQGKKPLDKEWLRVGNVSETSGVSSAGGFKPIRKMKRMMTTTSGVARENDGL